MAAARCLSGKDGGWLTMYLSLLLPILLSPLCAAWDNVSQPLSIFRSRPDLQAPVLYSVQGRHYPDKMAPGYYFISPYQHLQNGIYIYDNDASLIFSGFGSTGPGTIHSPQTCKYKGEVHLCFYQGQQMLGWGHGHAIIMDKHYRVVRSIEPSGTYQASSDMHEFKLINDGKTALLTQYIRSAYDLCPFSANLCDGLAYIQQGVFQEVDVETGAPIFTWHSLDHIPPSESYVLPSTTDISGSGELPDSPWDYFHINSIDKNDDGDYLISARHVSAIYKISGKDGHIMWRLNGAKSDYRLINFSFTFQHDARFISDTPSKTVISLFDNGSNGWNNTQPLSMALIVELDHNEKTARVINQVDSTISADGFGHLSKSQGSYQILPNDHQVVGWGNEAFWTEYDADGEVVFDGGIGTVNVMNYRVHKFNDWVGIPLTKPALWTFSLMGYNGTDGKPDPDNVNPSFLYVSWNGHTQISSWRFYGSNTHSPTYTYGTGNPDLSSFTDIVTVAKSGFETIHYNSMSYRYTYAAAYSSSGTLLGKSAVVETYVPSERLRPFCDELACSFTPANDDEREKVRLQMAEQQRQREQAQREAARKKEEKEKTKKDAVFISSFVGLGLVAAAILWYAFRGYVTLSSPYRSLVVLFGRAKMMVSGPNKKAEGLLGMSQYSEVPTRAVDGDDGDDDLQDWRRRGGQRINGSRELDEELYKIASDDEEADGPDIGRRKGYE